MDYTDIVSDIQLVRILYCVYNFMNNLSSLLLLLLVLCSPVLTYISAELSGGKIVQSAFNCLGQQNFPTVIIRANTIGNSQSVVDANVVSNINNAKVAGLTAQIYIDICRSVAANDLVDNIYNSININQSTNYAILWVKVQTNSATGCQWNGYSQADNCDYVKSIINRAFAYKLNSGIFSTYNVWNNLLGTSCIGIGSLSAKPKLWFASYLPANVLDTVQSTASYQPFGGWTWPLVKQVSRPEVISLCGSATWNITIVKHWRSK